MGGIDNHWSLNIDNITRLLPVLFQIVIWLLCNVVSFETAFFSNKKTIFGGETSSILVFWSHNHISSIDVKTYHQLESALNEPRYYSCLPHMLEPWNGLTKPLQPAKIKANTQTNKKKPTSVPYPSEYLVIITLFLPQCSHRSVSWADREKRHSVKLFIKS